MIHLWFAICIRRCWQSLLPFMVFDERMMCLFEEGCVFFLSVFNKKFHKGFTQITYLRVGVDQKLLLLKKIKKQEENIYRNCFISTYIRIFVDSPTFKGWTTHLNLKGKKTLTTTPNSVFYISDKNYTQTPKPVIKNFYKHTRKKKTNGMNNKNLNLYPITFTFCGYLKHPLPFFSTTFCHSIHKRKYFNFIVFITIHKHIQLLGQRFAKISKHPYGRYGSLSSHKT